MDDLLAEPLVQPVTENPWKDKVVLITGVAGTVGQEILSQLARRDVRAIIGVDNNESGLFQVEGEFGRREDVSFRLGDIGDLNSLLSLFEGVDIVVHVAAHKHVSLCESAPRAAVQTNIVGTQNVVQAASAAGVERMLFTSSDKAVNPTSVMGTSKLMAERLLTAANAQSRSGKTIFASCRFGNVLGSRGSVVPLFRSQIARGGPVTLTHPSMTRFIMTLSEAVSLVMQSVFMARGGEVFVTKMPVSRIHDLATVMIEELAPHYGHDPASVQIEIIGPKPGEKFYEELMNEEEIRRAIELPRHFVIAPALRSMSNGGKLQYPGADGVKRPGRPYNSSTEVPMDKEELRQFLRANDFLTR